MISKSRKNLAYGLSESILIVTLLAVAILGVVTIFGDNLRTLFVASSQALTGQMEKPISQPLDPQKREPKDETKKANQPDPSLKTP